MIRSSACQPWQSDLPGYAGDRGDPAQLHPARGQAPSAFGRSPPRDSRAPEARNAVTAQA
jgi:hypothetical protein